MVKPVPLFKHPNIHERRAGGLHQNAKSDAEGQHFWMVSVWLVPEASYSVGSESAKKHKPFEGA
jgi:hypothetical protein